MRRASKRPDKPSATPAARYRVALHGFSEFERNALAFCLKHAAERDPAYVQVDRLADSDFIVADASHEVLATSATRGPRMRDTLFVGEHAPPGARSHVERPIDPENILRALDDMAAARDAPSGTKPKSERERPDIVLPLPAGESDFPTLSEFDIIETTPAAFHHEPVLINLADLEPIARRRPQKAPSPEVPREVRPEVAPGPAPEAEARAGRSAAAATGSSTPVDPAPQSLAPNVTPPAEPPARPHSPVVDDDAEPAPALGEIEVEDVPVPESVAHAEPPLTDPAPATAPPPSAHKRALTSAERAEAKAEARRRSRRARLAQAGRAGAESLRDVLLLGPERANAELGALLQVFGFHVHPATFSADALALIAGMPLAAVFLDVAPGSEEDMDGLELCMEIKQRRAALAGAVPPVFLLANRDSAAGRVRAELAGCNALLIRPVTRGDAARALEAADVALPADQRRIERP
jgi:CheY-like chemotaxis protein